MRDFLTDEQGDTTTGVALGAILVLLVIVVSFVFVSRSEQPGVDIRIGT